MDKTNIGGKIMILMLLSGQIMATSVDLGKDIYYNCKCICIGLIIKLME